jgi:hypothetical protein
MTGTLSLSSDLRWSAASWLFDWVLGKIARDIKDVELSAAINGVVGENLGWFSLDELTEEQQSEIQQILRESVMTAADREFPDTMPGRKDALNHLTDLAAMSAHLGSAP